MFALSLSLTYKQNSHVINTPLTQLSSSLTDEWASLLASSSSHLSVRRSEPAVAHARDDGTVGARTGGGHDDRVAARAHARGGQQCLTRWGRGGGGGDWIEEKTNWHQHTQWQVDNFRENLESKCR